MADTPARELRLLHRRANSFSHIEADGFMYRVEGNDVVLTLHQ